MRNEFHETQVNYLFFYLCSELGRPKIFFRGPPYGQPCNRKFNVLLPKLK